MLQLVACAICGGDPAVDSMLINGAISGAIAMPWIFRAQVSAAFSRLRGRPVGTTVIGDACTLPRDSHARSRGEDPGSTDA
jgi:hypothetical protein